MQSILSDKKIVFKRNNESLKLNNKKMKSPVLKMDKTSNRHCIKDGVEKTNTQQLLLVVNVSRPMASPT